MACYSESESECALSETVGIELSLTDWPAFLGRRGGGYLGIKRRVRVRPLGAWWSPSFWASSPFLPLWHWGPTLGGLVLSVSLTLYVPVSAVAGVTKSVFVLSSFILAEEKGSGPYCIGLPFYPIRSVCVNRTLSVVHWAVECYPLLSPMF